MKIYVSQTMRLESGMDCSMLAVNWKNENDVTVFWYGVIVNFLDVALFLFSSLVTCPRFMSILSLVLELWQFLFIRDWPEIGNSPVWVLSNFWRLAQVNNTKFGTIDFNKILLIAARYQGYNFYRSWVNKGKPTGDK